MSHKPTLEAIAYHEAGHAVAALISGARNIKATIIPAKDYSGRVTQQNPLRGIHLDYDGSNRARLRAEKAVFMALAGPAAQRRFSPRSFRRWHAQVDHKWAADIAHRLSGSAKVAERFLAWQFAVAEDFVDGQWAGIEGVANALLSEKTLDDERVREAYSKAIQQVRQNPCAALQRNQGDLATLSEEEKARIFFGD